MAKEEIIESIGRHLFAEQDANVYAVLDGASVTGLLDKLYGLSPNFCCLFRGELQPDMAEVAPYLVQLEPESEFTSWVIGQGWGNHWGMFATSEADFRQMRTHFRTFLIVHDETGRPLRFRYYDPRVLRTFLPTCTTEELTAIFGPVTGYVVEDLNPDLLSRFEIQSGALKQKRIAIVQA